MSTVRVMTWNVWWRFGSRWRDRQPLILRTLEEEQPDIVALQEVWSLGADSQPDTFAARLGLHGVFTETSMPPLPQPPDTEDQAGVSMGIGLLSRWPVRALRVEALPARHRPPPSCLVATINHPDGPLRVLVTCIEWEQDKADDQRDQVRALAILAREPAGVLPVLLAGDLNAPPDSPLLRPLLAVMDDAWLLADGDPAAVTLDSRHRDAPDEPHLIHQRIDHVLVRAGRSGRVRATSAHLAGAPVDGLDPSDHRAVVLDVFW